MTTTETRSLPVKLNDEDLLARAKQLASTLKDYDAVEAEKKEATADLSSRMRELRKEAQRLERIISSGREDRDVEVYEEANVVRAVWEVRRVDDDSLVESRPMSAEEIHEARQGALFDEARKKSPKSKKAKDTAPPETPPAS